jgi:hypothetical protein
MPIVTPPPKKKKKQKQKQNKTNKKLRCGGYNDKFKRIFQKLWNFYYCSSFLQTIPAMISTTSRR